MTQRLHIFLPSIITNNDISVIPSLYKLLARAHKNVALMERTRNQGSLEHHLFQTNIISHAAITALGYGLPADKGWWLHATPMYLQADLAGVYLMGNQHLAIDEQELTLLRTEIQTFLAEDNITFHAPTALDWFLQLPKEPKITTYNPELVIGKEISPYLPQGIEQDYWRTLFTELQMLLHQSKVNQKREREGLALVNSVWFWGEGQLPSRQDHTIQAIISQRSFDKGYAKLAQAEFIELPQEFNQQWLQQFKEEILLVLDSDDLITLEQAWFKPILHSLKNKEIEEVVIYFADNIYYVSKKDLWKFWRRLKLNLKRT